MPKKWLCKLENLKIKMKIEKDKMNQIHKYNENLNVYE